jgi:hypothetical protein
MSEVCYAKYWSLSNGARGVVLWLILSDKIIEASSLSTLRNSW